MVQPSFHSVPHIGEWELQQLQATWNRPRPTSEQVVRLTSAFSDRYGDELVDGFFDQLDRLLGMAERDETISGLVEFFVSQLEITEDPALLQSVAHRGLESALTSDVTTQAFRFGAIALWQMWRFIAEHLHPPPPSQLLRFGEIVFDKLFLQPPKPGAIVYPMPVSPPVRITPETKLTRVNPNGLCYKRGLGILGTTAGIATKLGLWESVVQARIQKHKVKPYPGRNASGRPCALYRLVRVRKVCKDLLEIKNLLNPEGWFSERGKVLGTKKALADFLGQSEAAIRALIKRHPELPTRDAKEPIKKHVITCYFLVDILRAFWIEKFS